MSIGAHNVYWRPQCQRKESVPSTIKLKFSTSWLIEHPDGLTLFDEIPNELNGALLGRGGKVLGVFADPDTLIVRDEGSFRLWMRSNP